MPCKILRFKMEDEIIQGLSEIFALTASDTFAGCLYLLEKFLKFEYKNMRETTKSCGFAPWEPSYLTDPCCSAKNNPHVCCKPKERTVTKREVIDINKNAVADHCAADQSSQATFVQMGINAAQAYVDGLADLQNCFGDYEAFIQQARGIPRIFDNCTSEVRGEWDATRRMNVGKSCSSDDDCYSKSCDGQNCVVPVEGEAGAVLRCLSSQVNFGKTRQQLLKILKFERKTDITNDDLATELLKRYSKFECRGPEEQKLRNMYGCIDDSEDCPVTRATCERTKSCNWEPSITRQNFCSSGDPFFCSPSNCVGCGSITVKEGCEIDLRSSEELLSQIQTCEERLEKFYAENASDEAEVDAWKDLENEKSTCLSKICKRNGGEWVREGRGSGRCYDASATTPDLCSAKGKCYSQDGPQPALQTNSETNTEMDRLTLCQEYNGQCTASEPSSDEVTQAIEDACAMDVSDDQFGICAQNATNDVSSPEARCSLMSFAQKLKCEARLVVETEECEKGFQTCNTECQSACDAGDFECDCGCEEKHPCDSFTCGDALSFDELLFDGKGGCSGAANGQECLFGNEFSETHHWVVGRYDTQDKCEAPYCDSDRLISDVDDCAAVKRCSRRCDYCTARDEGEGVCVQSMGTDATTCSNLSGTWECDEDGDSCACFVDCSSEGEELVGCENLPPQECLTNEWQFRLGCRIDSRKCKDEAECQQQGDCTDSFVEAGTCILPFEEIGEDGAAPGYCSILEEHPAVNADKGGIGNFEEGNFDTVEWDLEYVNGLGCSLAPATYEEIQAKQALLADGSSDSVDPAEEVEEANCDLCACPSDSAGTTADTSAATNAPTTSPRNVALAGIGGTIQNLGISFSEVLGNKKFLKRLNAARKRLSEECKKKATELLTMSTCTSALTEALEGISADFTCQLIVNLTPQLKAAVEDVAPGSDAVAILGLSGLDTVEACKASIQDSDPPRRNLGFTENLQKRFFEFERKFENLERRKLRTSGSKRVSASSKQRKVVGKRRMGLGEKVRKLISESLVPVFQSLKTSVLPDITASVSSCAGTEQTCVQDIGNALGETTYGILKDMVRALGSKNKKKVAKNVKGAIELSDNEIIAKSLKRKHCTMMGGTWYEKARERSKCLTEKQSCCGKNQGNTPEGNCRGKFFAQENEISCNECGARARWGSIFRWRNVGRWREGKIVPGGQWLQKDLDSENKWTRVMDREKIKVLFETAVTSLKRSTAAKYAYCKMSRMNASLKATALACGVGNLEAIANTTDIEVKEELGCETASGGELVTVGANSIVPTTEEDGCISFTGLSERQYAGLGVSGEGRRRRSLAESRGLQGGEASAEFTASCYTVVANANEVLVGQLIGACLGFQGTATSISGSFDLCLKVNPNIPKADYFTTYDFAEKSDLTFNVVGSSAVYNEADNTVCADVAAYGTYCPIYRVANYEDATESADGSCGSLDTVLYEAHKIQAEQGRVEQEYKPLEEQTTGFSPDGAVSVEKEMSTQQEIIDDSEDVEGADDLQEFDFTEVVEEIPEVPDETPSTEAPSTEASTTSSSSPSTSEQVEASSESSADFCHALVSLVTSFLTFMFLF